MNAEDIEAFDLLHAACRANEMSYSIEWCEGPNTWYVDVHGSGYGEKFVSRDYSNLHDSIDTVLDWIKASGWKLTTEKP